MTKLSPAMTADQFDRLAKLLHKFELQLRCGVNFETKTLYPLVHLDVVPENAGIDLRGASIVGQVRYWAEDLRELLTD